MNIHEARSLFISITSEFLDVATVRYESKKFTWQEKSERLSLLKEFLEDKKWYSGFYSYTADVWEISRAQVERSSVVRYLTTDGRVIYQERCLPEGGNIDDVQINISVISSTCSSVEALLIVCREMLVYAQVFGLMPEKIRDFYQRFGEPAPRPKLFVVR